MIIKESIFESKGSSILGQGNTVRGGLTNSNSSISDSLAQPSYVSRGQQRSKHMNKDEKESRTWI